MLQKLSAPINFSQGLDTKTDPKQVGAGKFSTLVNSVFDKGGLLKKRNGYGLLSSLPNTTANHLTTLNGNLTAVGNSIFAYSKSSAKWISRGSIHPLEVKTLPLIRNSVNQSQCDMAVAENGLICTVYTEANAGSSVYKYVISDPDTGQNIIAPTLIPVASGTVTGSPRVFLLGNFFVIVFTNVITAVSHLQYITVSSVTPSIVSLNTDIASAYISSTRLSWDAVVVNSSLYIAYNTTTGGQSVKVTTLNSNFIVATAKTFAGSIATIMSLCADVSSPSSPKIYVSFYDSAGSTGHTLVVDAQLNTITGPTSIIASGTVLNLASAAQNGSVTVFSEVSNAYGYDSGIASNYINAVTMTSAGVVGSPYVVVRSVGLGSKAFIVDSVIYFLSSFSSPYQPTYFLINGSTSTQSSPVVMAKLAYENGGGYLSLGLPNVVVNNSIARVPYLFKDLVQALSTQGDSTQSTTGGIYAQTGINLSSFTIGTDNINTTEIASDLHVSGGFLWMYDGYLPVEHNFFLWPDSVECTWSATGGSMHAQPDGATNTNAYYYQALYEWSDNQGNIFRSAPSIPVAVTTTGSATTGSVTVNVPTLRLTYKTANPLKVVIYRWSVANPNYYQVTSITSPKLNSTTADSVSFVDTQADSSIVGNSLIYTTGGVLEDVNAPATNIMTLFDTRLWLVDSEDPNLLWFSKQVIESTPVEMSDLLTFYVAPTTAAQGSTGKITALAPMDDKLIIFKENAIYYINGSGPDNTGASNQYSQPIFVTSTVGCSNQQSIVFMPQGLMFQSNKGIWLLGRDLSTNYIGAAVEAFNDSTVQSAINVPETNQVRFTLSTGETLMFDYYYGQWGTFEGAPAISSCIYEGLHSFLNSYGDVYQETPNLYLDGSRPVLLNFTTSWLNFAGLQGYQRAYFFYLLGQYLSPHKLMVSVAYDYNSSPTQVTMISPDNYSQAYGNSSPFGQGSPYGGPGDVEQWRVFLQRQRCQAFQISIQEVYDPSFGVVCGAGFTLSGLNFIYGAKSSFRPQPAKNSVG